MKYLIILTLVFSLSATTYSNAQTKAPQKEQFQNTYNTNKALVTAQEFQFSAEVVFNDSERKRLTESDNTLIINKTDISGDLVQLNSDSKTYNLEGGIGNYQTNFSEEKQTIYVEFDIKRTALSTVKVSIEIKPNGNAFLSLDLGSGNIIFYRGSLK